MLVKLGNIARMREVEYIHQPKKSKFRLSENHHLEASNQYFEGKNRGILLGRESWNTHQLK